MDLPFDGCEVWWVRMPVQAIPVESFFPAIDAVHRDALQRFLNPVDRMARASAHALMRLRAAARLGVHVGQLQTAVRPGGKPYFVGRTLRFSLTHCRALVGVAFSQRAELGLDVEGIREFDRTELLGLMESILTPGERAEVAIGPDAPSLAFLKRWTLKEAIVKATREGLARDLSGFGLRLPAGLPPEWEPAGQSVAPGSWGLQTWNWGGHVMALARWGCLDEPFRSAVIDLPVLLAACRSGGLSAPPDDD